MKLANKLESIAKELRSGAKYPIEVQDVNGNEVIFITKHETDELNKELQKRI